MKIELNNGSTIETIQTKDIKRSPRGTAYILASQTGRSFEECYSVLIYNKLNYDLTLELLQERNTKGDKQ